MQPQTNRLPENLLPKFSRIYRSKNSFKADDGQVVEYERLVLESLVKGEPITIEVPIKRDGPVTPKDMLLLALADTVDSGAFAPVE